MKETGQLPASVYDRSLYYLPWRCLHICKKNHGSGTGALPNDYQNKDRKHHLVVSQPRPRVLYPQGVRNHFIQDPRIALKNKECKETDNGNTQDVWYKDHRPNILCQRNLYKKQIGGKNLDWGDDKEYTKQINEIILERMKEYTRHSFSKKKILKVTKTHELHGADPAPLKQAVNDGASNREHNKTGI